MDVKNEKFETFFKAVSYGTIFCGFISLLASGGIGFLTALLFIFIAVLAWFLEGGKWQISERLGVIIIFLIVPLFYLDWRYQISDFNTIETIASGNLSRLILVLAGIKLLQKKGDRDWIFLYLISFFKVLLAAGMSISLLFVASLIAYVVFAVTSIVAFEIRKSSRAVLEKNSKSKKMLKSVGVQGKTRLSQIPVTAFALLLLISGVAAPLFFLLPRVGGAGFGKSLNGLTGFSGFSEFVRLGDIGRLQQSDKVALRVQIDETERKKIRDLRWRGVALDFFDKKSWLKSRAGYSEPFVKTERDFFIVDAAADAGNLVAQTVYLEPIDTPVLFSLARPIAFQGSFQVLKKDAEGAITSGQGGMERASYKVFSDITLPDAARLRADDEPYGAKFKRYLQLPDALDAGISDLARQIIRESNAGNRLEQAQAIENYLQNNYGYTLDLKAGGDEPLTDFLFNVREGHCEYFATAMAVMLRTQGVATRVVNGFQAGDYNETAGVYVVRQKNAHSWVEVYFPGENVWIPFDPTPAAGQFSGTNSITAFDQLNNYLEAFETLWIQYVVSYDNQGQRTLFRSVRSGVQDLQGQSADWLSRAQSGLNEWWKEARGDKGFESSVRAAGIGAAYFLAAVLGLFLLVWLVRTLWRNDLWMKLKTFLDRRKEPSIVEFYERMSKILESKGLRRAAHQTPLEFAFSLSLPQAVRITEKYNLVRFGEKNLSEDETQEIENWLNKLEE